MGKIISIFNHKGGVGKTTLTYHLSWALAESGKKVLMLDADPQQNLSLLVRGNLDEEKELNISKSLEHSSFWDTYLNIYDVFSQFLYAGSSEVNKPIFCKEHKNLKNPSQSGKLDLLLGSLDVELINRDLPLMLAQSGGGRNIAYQFQSAIDNLAELYDYVIIDLSPSISQFNLLMVMTSHYWIAPVFPNRFCYRAMSSMQDIFNTFHEQMAQYKETGSKRGLDIRYKFLGYVTQNFRRNTKSGSNNIVNAFENWRLKINEEATKLADYLYDSKRSLSATEFKSYFPGIDPYNLSEISDFNRLGVMSQKYGIPSYRLTNDVLIKDDKDKDQLKKDSNPASDDFERMKSWETSYNELASRLSNLP